MAYSLENTADLTALGDAIRAKSGNTGALTVEGMETAIRGLVGITPPDTQLKRLKWTRTQTETIGKNSSRSFNISVMNSNKKYPFVFFTKLSASSASGYPPYSVFIVYDGTQYTWTYKFPTIDVSGSVVFNDTNAVLTLTNNTRANYDMRFANSNAISGSNEEYAELFYFCPVE